MRAVFVLELQAGMGDFEVFLQPVLDRSLDLFDFTPAVRCQHHVAVQRRLVLLHLPQMHVVNVRDTIDIPHRLHDGCVVDVGRAAKHQGSNRAADLGKSQIEDV